MKKSGTILAVLVVAADDGVMPQTREHLDILTLMGVRHGLVALTKSDLVDAEMLELAAEGMTMVVVSHEMGFVRAAADRVVFMDEGQIVEVGTPEHFFRNPTHDRTKLFLSQIL